MTLLPRSLYGRLLATALFATLAALAFAAVAIGAVLDRFVGGTIDARLADRTIALSTAVHADGTIDGRVVQRLDALIPSGEPWRIDAPHGVAGTRRNGAYVVSFNDDPHYMDPHAPPHREPARHGPRPLPPGIRPFEANLADGLVVHGLTMEVPIAAGSASVIATVPRRVIDRPLRAAMLPLLGSLLLLGLALGTATLVQLRIGLAPLDRLRAALAAIRSGKADAIPADQPTELAPLATEINALLEQNAAALANARGHVANLAHGLKTPLATLTLALRTRDPDGSLSAEVARIDQAVRHHLGRARAATPGAATRVATLLGAVVADLVAALARIHAERGVTADVAIDPALGVAVDRQDLDELIGNLLDNAWRWSARRIAVSATRDADGRAVVLTIADDGPGIPPETRATALAAGQRLDERGDGHGFGLSIAQDLAMLYGGTLTLGESASGGLAAIVALPAAAADRA